MLSKPQNRFRVQCGNIDKLVIADNYYHAACMVFKQLEGDQWVIDPYFVTVISNAGYGDKPVNKIQTDRVLRSVGYTKAK